MPFSHNLVKRQNQMDGIYSNLINKKKVPRVCWKTFPDFLYKILGQHWIRPCWTSSMTDTTREDIMKSSENFSQNRSKIEGGCFFFFPFPKCRWGARYGFEEPSLIRPWMTLPWEFEVGEGINRWRWKALAEHWPRFLEPLRLKTLTFHLICPLSSFSFSQLVAMYCQFPS